MTLNQRSWTSAVRNPNVKVRYSATLSLLIHIHRHVYAYFVTRRRIVYISIMRSNLQRVQNFPWKQLKDFLFRPWSKYCILIVKHAKKELKCKIRIIYLEYNFTKMYIFLFDLIILCQQRVNYSHHSRNIVALVSSIYFETYFLILLRIL